MKQSSTERQSYYDHNQKAKEGKNGSSPYKYVSIIMDGMDQAKTRLPHWDRAPKYMDDKMQIDLHLMGVLIQGYHLKGCYVDWTVKQQFKDNSNALLTTLEHILQIINKTRYENNEPQPEVLYLQLDNVSTNKNHWLLGYACWLVQQKMYKKVKISFLLVGHTHENIDQFFSRLSCALRNKRALCLPDMIDVVAGCSTPSPISRTVKRMYDFQKWMDDAGVRDVHEIKKSQIFTINLNDMGKAVVRAKRYSNSPKSKYSEEIEVLPTEPGPVRKVILPRAYQQTAWATDKRSTPLDLLKQTQRVLEENQPVGWDEDASEWWDRFINSAQEAHDRPQTEMYERINLQWHFGNFTALVEPEPLTLQHSELTQAEVDLVEPPFHPITTKRVAKSVKDRRSGDPAELKVGDMMIMKPEKDQLEVVNTDREADVVTPFWVAEVVSVEGKRNIVVHWYGADVNPSCAKKSEDWGRYRFTKRYRTTGTSKKGLSKLTSTLDRYKCGLLAYGFKLKTSSPVGSVPALTLKLVRERMEEDELEESLDRELDQ